MKGVAEFIEKIVAAGCSDASQDRHGVHVASTSTLGTEKNEWQWYGPTDYALEDFRTINRLAYFDYQRDRVFARSQRKYIRSLGKQKRVSIKPNKTITLRAAKCPVCHSRNIEALTRASHDIIDLKFMSAGNKRWITRFKSWRYRCDHCGNRFDSHFISEMPKDSQVWARSYKLVYLSVVGRRSEYKPHSQIFTRSVRLAVTQRCGIPIQGWRRRVL